MFFFAALFVASFLAMTLLAPKPKIENARASALSDFNFPRAKEGDPIPRGYGTYKTKGPNAIYLGDFEARPITKKVKTGLFSSKKQIVGYKYFTGLDLAVALGECVTFRRMFMGKHEVWNGCIPVCQTAAQVATIDLPDLFGGQDQNGGVGGTVAFYSGDFDQDQDPYLIAQLGANVPAYVGIAHVVFRKFWFGNSASVEAVSFEVSHFSNSLGLFGMRQVMPNGLDANPVEVLYDLYINDWGNLAVDPSLIDVDNWRTIALAVWSENNGFSAEIANPQSGADISKEILRQINGMVYEDPSTGTIKLKLIRNDYDVSTLPTLGPSEVKAVRNFTKTLWEETYNRVRVTYTDRAQDYKEDAVAVQDDFSNIRFQSRIKATEVAMPGVKNADLANAIAARELTNKNVPLFQAELEVNRNAVILKPGDVFKFSWPEYNIVSIVLRVRKFGLGTRENGSVTMTVVQDEFSVDATVYATPAASIDTRGTYAPTDIATFNVFELPYFLRAESGETIDNAFTRYAAFAAKPGAASIDYFALVSEVPDDAEVMSNAPYIDNAKIVSDILKFDGWTAGYIANVVIHSVTNADVLTNSDVAGIAAGHNLFYLGDELLAYTTFTDNGDGTYTLHNVYRGLIDTGYEAHTADDRLYFFEGQEGFIDEAFAVPSSLDLYLLDRTISARSTKAGATITTLTPATPTRAQRPAPPDYVTVDAGRVANVNEDAGAVLAVAWRERNRTTAAIALEADATGTAEAATTYDLTLNQAGTDLVTASAIVGTSYSLTVPPTAPGGLAEIRVWAKRDGFASLTPAVYPITIISAETLEIDSDPVTIDGTIIEFD